MKYVIMCGVSGTCYDNEHPRQLLKVNGEVIVERTIRLLKANGVDDIVITSQHPAFDKYAKRIEIPNAYDPENERGYWVDAFLPLKEPACYIMGDVYFSEEAIKTIVEYDTTTVNFFSSSHENEDTRYMKCYGEPFAFKVHNQFCFRSAIEDTKALKDINTFIREPIAWELWNVLTKQDNLNGIAYDVIINDYTCDVDGPEDAAKLTEVLTNERVC